MSANIKYRVVEQSNDELDVSAPSSFITAMENAFGQSPWRLGSAELATLRGMAAVSGKSLGELNPFVQMINEIEVGWGGEKHRTIEVWPEY